MILDADGDTTITADTDDQIDIKVGGSDTVHMGLTTYNASDRIVLTNTSGNASMAIVAGTSGESSVFMADGTSGDASYRGYVQYQHTNDNMNFGTAGSEAMRIDSSGNVGIGCTDPQTPLEIDTSTANYRIQFTHTSGQNLIKSIDSDHSTMRSLFYDASEHVFQTSGTERMRIDSSGALLMGTTSQITSTSEEVLHIENGDGVGQIVLNNTRSSGNQYMIQIRRLGTLVGSIQATTTATSYVTSSDYRLKENIVPMEKGLERVNKLKPVKFNWKNDGTISEGFIAHEVQEAGWNEGVIGEKDSEEMQMVDYAKLTPLLAKAIQEQQEQIEALQSEINILKGG
jgi:hypothetical protein